MLVIVDCDPGIDDSLALLFMLADARVELLGLTIVHGNSNDLELLARNARTVLGVAGVGEDVPVICGCRTTLLGETHGGAPHVHGQDALGDVGDADVHMRFRASSPLPSASAAAAVPARATTPAAGLHAAQFIVEQCRTNPGQITLVTLGPMTNVALALQLEPNLPRLVKRVYSMGGAISCPGNIRPLAEANVYNDVEAAKVVLASFPVTLTPLNVTTRFTLSDDDLQAIRNCSYAGEFVYAITRFYVGFFRSTFKREHIAVHDGSAMMAMLYPDVFTQKRNVFIDVETRGEFTRGTTVADIRASTENADETRQRNVEILLDVDADRARALLLKHLASYGPRRREGGGDDSEKTKMRSSL